MPLALTTPWNFPQDPVREAILLQRVVLTTLAVLLGHGVAYGQILELEGRYWFTELSSGSVKAENKVTGNDVDFRDDLGLKANGAPEGRLTLFTGSNSRLRLAYTHLTFDGDKTLSRTVTFKNQQFTANMKVLSDIEINYGRAGWIWQPFNIPGVLKFGGLFDIKAVIADASLRTSGLTPDISASGTFPLVLPTLGLALDVTPPALSMLHLFGEVSGLPVGNLGHMVDAEVGLRYIPIRFFTVSAGYRVFDLKWGTGEGTTKFTLIGPFVGMSVRF